MTTKTAVSVGRLVLALALLGAFAGATPALAADKRIGILKFHGPGEGASRNAVGRVVKAKGYQIVGAQQLDKTAKRLGVKLNGNEGFRTVAKELGITAFVAGEVTKRKASLTIRNGADGSEGGDASWTGANPRKLAASVEKTFWKRLGDAIENSKAPSGAKNAVVAEEEAAPETGADDAGGATEAEAAEKPSRASAASESSSKSEEKEEAPPPRRAKKKVVAAEDEAGSETTATARASASDEAAPIGVEAVDVGIGLGVLMRSLSYNAPTTPEPSYSLPRGPGALLAADVFPGALLGMSGFASQLGLTVGVNALIPGTVTTRPPTGPGSYATRGLGWNVGVKARVFSGLFASVAYGSRAFGLTASGGATPSLVPMTDYRYGRIGVGGRWRLTPEFALMLNLGYLQGLGFGDIKKLYPKISGAGVEGGLAAGYRITSKLEARAGVDFQRFGLAFNVPFVTPAPAHVAGGAIDQYVSIWVGVAAVLGGSDAAHGETTPSEAEEEGGDDARPAPKKSKGKSDDDDAS